MAEEKNPTTFPLTPGQTRLVIIFLATMFLLYIYSHLTMIPYGTKGRNKALPFLLEHFPNQKITPDLHGYESEVAVIFHLIRSGDPEIARKAIDLAAEQEFGYAAPYVIERLGSDDPNLERSAQNFLQTIAEGNYGPDRESWRAWWQNPPRKFFGFTVEEYTVAIAIVLIVALVGISMIVIGNILGRSTSFGLGLCFLFLAWFGVFDLTMTRFGGRSDICYFGSTPITYFSDHGAVIGLEDYSGVDKSVVDLMFCGNFLVFILLWLVSLLLSPRPKKVEASPPTPYQHNKKTI
jgi:hypothetical protein